MKVCQKWEIVFTLFLTLAILSTSGQSPAPFRIVGYYSLEAARTVKPRKIPFLWLTHINLFFLNPDTLGNFTRDLKALKPFIDAAHRKMVQVLFSIAGGSPHPYYHRLLRDEMRQAFIDHLVDQTVRYNADGIDVDIEGGDIDENYEKFVVGLAAALKVQNKIITAAVAVYYKDHVTDTALAQYKFVNIMSYDRTGPWRPHEPGPHADMKAAGADLEYFGQVRHVPKENMNLGVPFYGYGFGPEPATSLSFARIIKAFKGAEAVDEWKSDAGQTYYYNGTQTILKKTALAKEKASGIMIWQIRQDAKGRKSLLRAIYKASR